ncbi:MAG: hypothetical protein OXF07_01715 [Rhodobacter sp.]|nr:hypothetical protein [Rhodobacter sp.]MCY4168718.1 hypothetical protein [Rhodobacter sp.]
MKRTTMGAFFGKVGGMAILAALALGLAQPAAAEVPIPGVTAQLEAADITVREGEDAVFELSLSRSFDFAVRYAYRTKDGTARAGRDYEAKQGHVVFPAGRRVAEIRVRTHMDNIVDNEHFELALSDVETHGYGMVWFQYVWTDRWRVEGLPDTKTVRAWIRNVVPSGTNALLNTR